MTPPTSPPAAEAKTSLPPVDIKPLLQQLWPGGPDLSPAQIASAISHFFTNQVSEAQAASLLICLHFTGLDRRGDVLAECARVMRVAAEAIDVPALEAVIKARNRAEGEYRGGLVSRHLPLPFPMLSSGYVPCFSARQQRLTHLQVRHRRHRR